MTNLWSIWSLSLVTFACFGRGCSSHCPVLECWFLQEKKQGGASGSQEKILLDVGTEGHHRAASRHAAPDSSIRTIYSVEDPAATLCHRSLRPPSGSTNKPLCEISSFLPQPSSVKWAASLTESALSPIHLQADWLAGTLQGVGGELSVSSVLRAATGTSELDVVLSVTTTTVAVKARLSEPVLLDCQFWADPASPQSGFAVEWRYQYRGSGQLILAYDGKADRLSDTLEEGAMMDIAELHRNGNASLILQKAKVSHSGTYICMVYRPHLLAQVTMELEIAEPPSLSIYPTSLPLTVAGQSLTVHCEASGFAPYALELSWELKNPDGTTRPLGPGRLTGHRQAWDGTYSQDTRLELDTSTLDLGRGGEVTCVGQHSGGTRRASVTLRIIGFSTPSIEDSMAMVGVALVLYGLIKFVSWTFIPSGSSEAAESNKKEK
ncbi:TAP binding protein (tapasin), tandem duplicate 1 [Dunckerocampus dactyliophorus]|uniref:TAP binding protein (tapasin), tandem duplicate 1 n=1 Tax=Dunckerocampus dactyliophorus TaxID=161453 RepID=UPI002404D19F|nr:TAP binding protein (tapasin), tandem duplicate 1 [Dunckerocampus dactyliophorus]